MKRRGRSKSAPAHRYHKASGQARVTINGKTHYLGVYDTAESLAKYKQLIVELWFPPGIKPNRAQSLQAHLPPISKTFRTRSSRSKAAILWAGKKGMVAGGL